MPGLSHRVAGALSALFDAQGILQACNTDFGAGIVRSIAPLDVEGSTCPTIVPDTATSTSGSSCEAVMVDLFAALFTPCRFTSGEECCAELESTIGSGSEGAGCMCDGGALSVAINWHLLVRAARHLSLLSLT